MPPAAIPLTPSASSWLVRFCTIAALVALLMILHCFGLPLLPEQSKRLSPEEIKPLSPRGSIAYMNAFADSDSNQPHNPFSRVRLFENDTPLVMQVIPSAQKGAYFIVLGRWVHLPGLIVFSATDNTDPRTNGRTYTLRYPAFSSNMLGGFAAMVFIAALAVLYRNVRLNPAARAVSADAPRSWRWHLVAIGLIFLGGLYCNTGTLAAYAVTNLPRVDAANGYLYNIDHEVFRTLYEFVNGADRTAWDKALLLRRILYPVLAWPFMRMGGFEAGGLVANLVYNWAGLLGSLWLFRRQVGERGAIFAGWLLALYPGAAYWAGLPYVHSLIFPCCLLLMHGLVALSDPASRRKTVLISLGMGAAYLAYDLIYFFLPATLLVLGWQRRWREAATSAATQMFPLISWGMFLHFGLNQPLTDSNSGVFTAVLSAYLHPGGAAGWKELILQTPVSGWHVWFGANFIFLPALFLAVGVLNTVTSRIRLSPAETALLLVTVGLFLFINLAPAYETQWIMRGSWVSRLYQPVFPALIFFAARWWQALPPLSRVLRGTVVACVLSTSIGNALIVFGSILGNPWRISEQAFYAFYAHNDALIYRPYQSNLDRYGRHPWGFSTQTMTGKVQTDK